MTRNIVLSISILLVSLLGSAVNAHAQFKEGAFTQTYNDTSYVTKRDSTDKIFSFKEYFGGLAHKNEMKIGTMFGGAIVLPGTAQIYNKDYWKLPIIYGGIGVCAGLGGHYLHQYNVSKKQYREYLQNPQNSTGLGNFKMPPPINYKAKRAGTWLMVGAGLFYWGSLMDGVLSYHSDRKPLPGRATVYSILLPGLGQAYNGEYWKMPIYWGGLAVSISFLCNNNTNYHRFKAIHNEATNPDGHYNGSISGETAKWYRDVYRRYRDYSIVATALVYLLQVVDANVFAYMHDFEVGDDIAMKVEPAIISPDINTYAMNSTAPASLHSNAVGLRIGFRF